MTAPRQNTMLTLKTLFEDTRGGHGRGAGIGTALGALLHPALGVKEPLALLSTETPGLRRFLLLVLLANETLSLSGSSTLYPQGRD